MLDIDVIDSNLLLSHGAPKHKTSKDVLYVRMAPTVSFEKTTAIIVRRVSSTRVHREGEDGSSQNFMEFPLLCII